MTKFFATKNRKRGDIIILVLLIITLVGYMELPLLSVLVGELRVSRTQIASEQALQIAEAGINYYQWHLAHFPTDYQDGTSHAGPYVHTYVDVDTQTTIGQYSLVITPPSTGSRPGTKIRVRRSS